MKPFTLTKEEFITRAMAGEVFIDIDTNARYFYDSTKSNPFRADQNVLVSSWDLLDGKTKQFTVERPKPHIERRWKWRKDNSGYTEETDCYHNDIKALPLHTIGWYKAEDCFIDVEIKD